ncbi:hypothetical protein SPB21_29780 [Leptothoe sp. ISB3NOV94-8A]|uniref:DUF11 domain-containing protein n=1 Tax=Adonisia turfae CCMR0081 TaxID=2292702 RepID=A0A6M0RXS5_9CYAN|nr:hypothetical protein [Adonisia turfae]NEZ60710.1 hypothetical protein [Adonisia turfae CCMR0081]
MMQRLFAKKRLFLGLSALALVGTVPFAMNQPVLAQLQDVTDAIVQAVLRPEVKLTLSAAKQVVELNSNGQETISWEALEGKVTVQPNDVLRYTVDGSNSGDVEAKGLSITQPIPAQTVYELSSAEVDGNAEIIYSIDGGESFVAEPMVEVTLPDGTVEEQPAPADMYTHVQWNFSDDLASAQAVKAFYNVKVQ